MCKELENICQMILEPDSTLPQSLASTKAAQGRKITATGEERREREREREGKSVEQVDKQVYWEAAKLNVTKMGR